MTAGRTSVAAVPTLLAAVAAAIGSAFAADARVCVRCNGPVAAYLCTVSAPDESADKAALKGFCAAELTRGGGHVGCGATAENEAECQGVPKALVFGGQVEEMTPEAPATGTTVDLPEDPATGSAPATVTKSARKKEPGTLVEMTQDAVDASGKQLKNAGEVVSGAGEVVVDAAKKTGGTVKKAAKSTWNCITSLFSNCN